MNNSNKHRKLAEYTISSNTFPHQREAAQQAFKQFEAGSRAVVIAAEMQSPINVSASLGSTTA
jgi:hypothetical protein